MIYIYSKEISRFVDDNNSEKESYIPYRVYKYTTELKLYKRYLLEDGTIIKINDKFTTSDDSLYYVVRINNQYQGVYSSPIEECIAEIVIDNKNIDNRPCIINDGEYYTGAEIKYWFYKNKESINFHSDLYNDFGQYIDMNSRCLLNDYNIYKLIYNKNTNTGKVISPR